MAIDVCPITDGFAAEIGDVDLSRPLSDEDLAAIKQAFWQYSVLVFPDQRLTAGEHLAFARCIGPLETSIGAYRAEAEALRLDKSLADVSNIAPDGTLWDRSSRQRVFQLGNRLWHTDSSFKHVPALASLLYARTIAPIGGHTEFADCRAAHDALPAARRAEIAGLIVEHSIFTSRARLGFTDFSEHERRQMPPVPQRLVRWIPESRRHALYLASHAGHVIDMDRQQGIELLAELMAHATQRQFVYTHRWRTNDLVMWDNRCTMHRGTAFDDLRWRRDVQRATVSDRANSCELPDVLADAA
ncbi:MAG: TauD/TfdA family dioxygenase [Burkholderiaceae bacterium]